AFTERNSYGNLVMLCPNCHAKIDSDPQSWPIERLKKIKAEQEQRNARRFEDGSRPYFSIDGWGVSRAEDDFRPQCKFHQLGGDPLPAVEWRWRGPRFQMEWRQMPHASIGLMATSGTFDLRSPLQDDDLVAD